VTSAGDLEQEHIVSISTVKGVVSSAPDQRIVATEAKELVVTGIAL